MIYVTSFWLAFVAIIATAGLLAGHIQQNTIIRRAVMLVSMLLIPASLYVFISSLGWSVPCRYVDITGRTILAFKVDEQQGKVWLFLDGSSPLTCDLKYTKDNVSKLYGSTRDVDGRSVEMVVRSLSDQNGEEGLEVGGRPSPQDLTVK